MHRTMCVRAPAKCGCVGWIFVILQLISIKLSCIFLRMVKCFVEKCRGAVVISMWKKVLQATHSNDSFLVTANMYCLLAMNFHPVVVFNLLADYVESVYCFKMPTSRKCRTKTYFRVPHRFSEVRSNALKRYLLTKIILNRFLCDFRLREWARWIEYKI